MHVDLCGLRIFVYLNNVVDWLEDSFLCVCVCGGGRGGGAPHRKRQQPFIKGVSP